MARHDHHDIILELIELCRDLKSEIIQELSYYRASVYKFETASQIEKKIEQLRFLCDIIGDESLRDSFQDYDITKRTAHLQMAPGECLLSTRVMNLHQATNDSLDRLGRELKRPSATDANSMIVNILRHRRQLLAICNQGSRPWTFFSSM